MNKEELKIAARKLLAAKSPDEVFGGAKTAAEAMTEYRRIAQMLHPDKHAADPELFELATEALVALNVIFAKIGASVSPPVAPRSPVAIEVGKRRYVVGDQYAVGDVATLYRVEGAGEPALLKVAHTSAENDLMVAEVAALKKLIAKANTKFFPRLIDSFTIRGTVGRRQAIVVPLYNEHVPIWRALATYPLGVDFRDVTWMFKRMLVAIGSAHRAGLAHGAVLPRHVLVHPKEHGAKIVGWTHSVPLGKPLRSISADNRAYYPPELLTKSPTTPSSDVYMAAMSAIALMSGGKPDPSALGVDVPPPIARFFKGCVDKRPGARPQDAWDLHEEYDRLLLEVIGKPKYRELRLRDGVA